MSKFAKFTKNEPIRVVQIGCGSMATGWVERATKRPEVSLVGLVDIRREAAEKLAAKFNLPPSLVYGTLPEALEKAKPEAVFNITVPSAHYEVTLAALAAGCHVLGEKPLSDSLAHAKEMCQAAKKAKRLYMVTQNRRYLGNIIAFQQALKNQVLGRLSSLDADFFIGAHFGGFRDKMEHALLLDMAIHSFDQARLISGCDPEAVYCHEYNPHGSWYKGCPAAICIFEMTNGVVFTYRGSWAAEGCNTSWECNWRAVGSTGSILWDGTNDPKAQVVASSEGFIRKMNEVPLPAVLLEHSGHAGVLDEFIRALKTGVSPQTACCDNLKSLAMVMAAIESATKHKRVKIKLGRS